MTRGVYAGMVALALDRGCVVRVLSRRGRVWVCDDGWVRPARLLAPATDVQQAVHAAGETVRVRLINALERLEAGEGQS